MYFPPGFRPDGACNGIPMHGATEPTNPGERRVVIYRYGPGWGQTRHGYCYSDELLARVTDERRKILQSITPRRPGVPG